MAKTIAVIGSGMAGLAAAWFLSRRARVTLIERHSRLGMGAHSVELPGGTVDVPLRVIYPGYYPQLFNLLRQVGVALQPLDASLSFSGPDGEHYFGYRNLMLAGRSLPWVAPGQLLRTRSRRILTDLGRFLLQAPRALARGELRQRSLGQYLDQQGYSTEFADGFLLPCFAGIATASCADVRAYPAEVIARYFSRAFVLSSVYRAKGGAAAIAQALSAPVAQCMFNTRLRGVARTLQGVAVTDEDGHSQLFDAVVFATQANQVAPLLTDATAAEQAVLAGVRYGAVRVVMHRDTALAPRQRAAWAPVNYMLSNQHDRPMASIWVNRLLRASYADAQPLFQTIDPWREADPKLVLQDTALQRPLVDLDTEANLLKLGELHREPGRRVFFCGSYAAPGIPLLESAVASAKALLDAPGLAGVANQ